MCFVSGYILSKQQNSQAINAVFAACSKFRNTNPSESLTADCVQTLEGVCMRLQLTVNTREQCREGQGQVTETVGPSVVKTQKSSDKFCGIEWSKRKRERSAAGHVLFPSRIPGRGHYNLDLQLCVN